MTGYRMFLVEAEMWFIEVRRRGSHLFTVALPIASLPMGQPAIGCWSQVVARSQVRIQVDQKNNN